MKTKSLVLFGICFGNAVKAALAEVEKTKQALETAGKKATDSEALAKTVQADANKPESEKQKAKQKPKLCITSHNFGESLSHENILAT